MALVPSLRGLNAGHNRIVSLAALRGCAQLEELWLHRNNIVSLREVEHLAVGHRVLVDKLVSLLVPHSVVLRPLQDLDNLRTLMLQGNPFCKTINKDDATCVRCCCLRHNRSQ